MGELRQAVEDALDPNNVSSLRNLAVAYVELGEPDKGRPAL